MKYILLKSISAVVIAMGLALASCSKWTDVEAKEIDHNGGKNTLSEAERDNYYASLRAWKKTAENYGRPVSFGLATGRPKAVCAKGILQRCPIV
uniref:hypothetical protein n=1 Tax=Capnocytophaga bilenii TaxID=2819369 RepID=UPI001F25B845|nr:hypothetical protein [Capnocytophaga bilenii]